MAQNLEGQLSLLGREDPAPKSQAQAGNPHPNLMSPSESSTGCTSWGVPGPSFNNLLWTSPWEGNEAPHPAGLGKPSAVLLTGTWGIPADELDAFCLSSAHSCSQQ